MLSPDVHPYVVDTHCFHCLDCREVLPLSACPAFRHQPRDPSSTLVYSVICIQSNIGSINDSAGIHEIEKMLSSMVTSPRTSFTYGTATDPPSPFHDLSVESMDPKLNPTPWNNRKQIKINTGVNRVSVTLSKSVKCLQPRYLQLRTNQMSYGSNCMRIHYSTRFISSLSCIPSKLFYHNLIKPTCCLWTIHP